MAIVIDFTRKQRGGNGTARASGDLYVSQVDTASDGRSKSVSLRFSKAVLAKLRWIVGDYVVATCEIDNGGKLFTWSARRVAGADAGGCKISGQGQAHKCGTARFAIDDASLATVFPGGVKGYSCEMVEHDGASAKFIGGPVS